MKYRLEFDDFNQDLKTIGVYDTIDEAFSAMRDDLSKKGIHPPFYRSWGDHVIHIDYGSYSQFYLITLE